MVLMSEVSIVGMLCVVLVRCIMSCPNNLSMWLETLAHSLGIADPQSGTSLDFHDAAAGPKPQLPSATLAHTRGMPAHSPGQLIHHAGGLRDTAEPLSLGNLIEHTLCRHALGSVRALGSFNWQVPSSCLGVCPCCQRLRSGGLKCLPRQQVLPGVLQVALRALPARRQQARAR